MSIQSEIDRIKSSIASAYTSVKEKNGSLPEVQNVGGLASAIDTIPPSIPPGGITNQVLVKSSDQNYDVEWSDLPKASATMLGTVIIGDGLSINEDGTVSYTLPTASTAELGGIKVGNNLSITKDGVLNAIDTTYSAATQTTIGLMSAGDKVKLDGIASGANNYTLPTASSTTLGGVKVGGGLSIAGNGILSVPVMKGATFTTNSESGLTPPATSGPLSRYLSVGGTWDNLDAKFLNVSGGMLDGSLGISQSSEVEGSNVLALYYSTTNFLGFRSVIAYNEDGTLRPELSLINSDGEGVFINGVHAPENPWDVTTKEYVDNTLSDNQYTLPQASATVLGGIKIGKNLKWVEGLLNATDTTYSPMIGATSESDGVAGLVPAPTKDSRYRALDSTGNWYYVSSRVNATFPTSIWTYNSTDKMYHSQIIRDVSFSSQCVAQLSMSDENLAKLYSPIRTEIDHSTGALTLVTKVKPLEAITVDILIFYLW